MKRFLVLLAVLSCSPKVKQVVTDPGVFDKPGAPLPPIKAPPTPGFQTLDVIEDSILLDLQNLGSDRERADARYLVGCDRSNTGQEIKEYEQGIDRGVNLLSSDRELYKTVPIGDAHCIYRVDLSSIGWDKTDWQTIEKNDILRFVSKTIRNQNIQFLTQTQRPYLYGDSALVTAFEGDAVANKNGAVYYKLVNQDIDTNVFLRSQGIDRQSELNDERGLFSGFSQSQIALGKTRLVAAFESNDGICIETYDTKFGGDDLFTNPFTKELAKAGLNDGSVNTNKIFKHDAQEHICTLPNGLFGIFRLNGADDKFAAVAPTDVVINIEGAKIDPAIRLGDCANCHYKDTAAIPFRDQLNSHIIAATGFDKKEKNLARIFFDYDQITAQMQQINRENARALTTLGITALQDPLWNVVTKPLRAEMSIDQIAGKFYMSTNEFTARLKGAAISSKTLGNLLTGGTVSLATFTQNFQVLIDELNLFADDEL